MSDKLTDVFSNAEIVQLIDLSVKLDNYLKQQKTLVDSRMGVTYIISLNLIYRQYLYHFLKRLLDSEKLKIFIDDNIFVEKVDFGQLTTLVGEAYQKLEDMTQIINNVKIMEATHKLPSIIPSTSLYSENFKQEEVTSNNTKMEEEKSTKRPYLVDDDDTNDIIGNSGVGNSKLGHPPPTNEKSISIYKLIDLKTSSYVLTLIDGKSAKYLCFDTPNGVTKFLHKAYQFGSEDEANRFLRRHKKDKRIGSNKFVAKKLVISVEY